MKVVEGIYLPDRDEHFSEYLHNSPSYKGKATYQYTKIQNALKHCTRRCYAIDIGANVGLWTRVLADEFYRVVAIEPVQENIDCLRLNIAHKDNVEIVPFGINQSTGMLSMRFMPGVATAEVVCYEDREFEVPCRPLDSFDFAQVDFIKIDAEGYEHFIVQSGEKMIRTWQPMIVVEQKKKRLDKYNLERQQPTVKLLESWGATEIWANAGDHCLMWV